MPELHKSYCKQSINSNTAKIIKIISLILSHKSQTLVSFVVHKIFLWRGPYKLRLLSINSHFLNNEVHHIVDPAPFEVLEFSQESLEAFGVAVITLVFCFEVYQDVIIHFAISVEDHPLKFLKSLIQTEGLGWEEEQWKNENEAKTEGFSWHYFFINNQCIYYTFNGIACINLVQNKKQLMNGLTEFLHFWLTPGLRMLFSMIFAKNSWSKGIFRPFELSHWSEKWENTAHKNVGLVINKIF